MFDHAKRMPGKTLRRSGCQIYPNTFTYSPTPHVFLPVNNVATSGPPSPLHTSNSPPVSSSLTSTTENPNPPSAIVDHGTTEPHFVSTITTSPFASFPPRSITTTTTQPPIPHPSHVNRLRERSPHDLHSERSHYDERTRHLSPRFDDPNDRYPPRRQYPRDRHYRRIRDTLWLDPPTPPRFLIYRPNFQIVFLNPLI